MDVRELSPGVVIAVIALVVAIVGFLMWRETAVKPYTGPPINMGAAMRAGQGSGPGAAPAPAPGGGSR